MDPVLVIAGAVFVIEPLQYRRSVQRIRVRMKQRGASTERFDRAMARGWVRAALVLAPILGVVLIVVGATE